MDEKSIFNSARRIVDDQARDEYLRLACGDDIETLKRIRELLADHNDFTDFLESPPVTASLTRGTSESAAPLESEIGPYKLLQEIGEGGMGTVYLAQQERPIRRLVALKIIKPGMDSKQVVARFESERQALAMMSHHNIAQVLDVGMTERGRPFFAMELIKGIPITKYCDDRNLTIEKRLQLFQSVCDAVQHAHQKGIIHRDLKPSNILVAEYDGKPVPKVIDFGLAKALDQPLTEKTMFTQLGQVVGTLEYMSPEQSTMNQLDVDTRTDIYSLGVLLYELLTGYVPFDKQRFRTAALDQVLKIIREEDPPKPSLRLSSLKSSVEMAKQRGVDPKLLGTQLRGDLDWIVMKAMEKDRSRRYDTANVLGMDIQRYMDGNPVSAAPPSTAYLLRKFANRNRVAIVVASLMLIMLIAGIGGTTWGLFEANLQKQSKSDFLYVAHMNMIQEAWESGLLSRARELLDRQLPRPGESDLRTFEWFYFDSLCRGLVDVPTIQYGDKVVCVAEDPASDLLALAGDDRKIQIWSNGSELAQMHELDSHQGNVIQLDYTEDGKFLLASGRGFIEVWQKSEAGYESAFQTKTNGRFFGQFSPGGAFVAFPAGDLIGLFDTSTLESKRLEGHSKPVTDVCFASHSQKLLSSSADGTIRHWDLATGTETELIVSKNVPIDAIKLADDDSKFAFVYDNQLSIQDLSADASEIQLDRVFGSAFLESLNDGRTLAVVTPTEISFWDFTNHEFLGRLNDSSQFKNGLSIDQSGLHFATHGSDSLVEVWDTKTLKLMRTIHGHSNTIYGSEFLVSGGLVTASRDNSAKIWKELRSTSELQLDAGPTRLWSISFSRDSRILAVACEDSRIVFWDPQAGTKLDELKGHRGSVQFVRFSPDDRLLASAGEDGVVRLWDLRTRKVVSELKGHGGVVNSLDFSPDGKLLVSGGNGGIVIVWDVDRMTEKTRCVMPPKSDVWAVSFGTDGHSVVFGGRGRSVYRWEFDTKHAPEMIRQMSENVTSFDVSPDGRWLSATTADGAISILDYSNGSLRNQLDGHSGDAMFATFSEDGKTLVSGGVGGLVQFWNLKTGERTVSFSDEGLHTHSMAFSPNGKFVAGVHWDGTTRIWRID